jgi:hypothetical protein
VLLLLIYTYCNIMYFTLILLIFALDSEIWNGMCVVNWLDYLSEQEDLMRFNWNNWMILNTLRSCMILNPKS